MKWGVRRYQNKDGTANKRTQKQISKQVYKAQKLLNSDKGKKLFRSIGKTTNEMNSLTGKLNNRVIDINASRKNDPVDKLNIYRDYNYQAKYGMEKVKMQRNSMNESDKILRSLMGNELVDAMYITSYKASKDQFDYTSQKVDSILNELKSKNVKITEVPSYREVNNGNSSLGWMGSKYVYVK